LCRATSHLSREPIGGCARWPRLRLASTAANLTGAPRARAFPIPRAAGEIMHPTTDPLDRRTFTKSTLLAGATLAGSSLAANSLVVAADKPKRIRTGLIGCGSVSNEYLPVLARCEFVELVSLCDRRYERARQQG